MPTIHYISMDADIDIKLNCQKLNFSKLLLM